MTITYKESKKLEQMADKLLKPKKRDSRPLVNGKRRRLSKKQKH